MPSALYSASDLFRMALQDTGSVKFPEIRNKLISIANEDSMDRENMPDDWVLSDLDKIEDRDRQRTKKMLMLLDACGTPSADNIGLDGSRAVWLIAMHSDLEVMINILNHFKALIKQGKENVFYHGIPFLEDRIETIKSGRQHFGTQAYINSEGEETLFPVVNERSVNGRRAKYGLAPLKISNNSRAHGI